MNYFLSVLLMIGMAGAQPEWHVEALGWIIPIFFVWIWVGLAMRFGYKAPWSCVMWPLIAPIVLLEIVAKELIEAEKHANNR